MPSAVLEFYLPAALVKRWYEIHGLALLLLCSVRDRASGDIRLLVGVVLDVMTRNGLVQHAGNVLAPGLRVGHARCSFRTMLSSTPRLFVGRVCRNMLCGAGGTTCRNWDEACLVYIAGRFHRSVGVGSCCIRDGSIRIDS